MNVAGSSGGPPEGVGRFGGSPSSGSGGSPKEQEARVSRTAAVTAADVDRRMLTSL